MKVQRLFLLSVSFVILTSGIAILYGQSDRGSINGRVGVTLMAPRSPMLRSQLPISTTNDARETTTSEDA